MKSSPPHWLVYCSGSALVTKTPTEQPAGLVRFQMPLSQMLEFFLKTMRRLSIQNEGTCSLVLKILQHVIIVT